MDTYYEESPSMEQKRYVASVCPEFRSRAGLLSAARTMRETVTCDECIHWNNGQCVIFDKILSSIDQT